MDTKTYKTALITGASSGLGAGLTKWFAARGTRVYAAARREEQLHALAESCRRDGGGEVIPLRMDVADVAATRESIERIDRESGGLQLVIANAGVGHETPAKRLEWDVVQQTIDVNVTGAAATLCAALPRMLERGEGHLVGIASLASYRGLPGSAAYCASKAFLRTFLESLRVDLSSTNVRVTCVNPGFVKSEMTAKNPKMPFLLETEDACRRMGEAIVRGEAEFSFPWQTATVMKVIERLPIAAYDAAARQVKTRRLKT